MSVIKSDGSTHVDQVILVEEDELAYIGGRVECYLRVISAPSCFFDIRKSIKHSSENFKKQKADHSEPASYAKSKTQCIV